MRNQQYPSTPPTPVIGHLIGSPVYYKYLIGHSSALSTNQICQITSRSLIISPPPSLIATVCRCRATLLPWRPTKKNLRISSLRWARNNRARKNRARNVRVRSIGARRHHRPMPTFLPHIHQMEKLAPPPPPPHWSCRSSEYRLDWLGLNESKS